ncbi:hypothetical protein KAH27_08900 [bacterium]|nr:hypothetical protein [bacterium]
MCHFSVFLSYQKQRRKRQKGQKPVIKVFIVLKVIKFFYQTKTKNYEKLLKLLVARPCVSTILLTIILLAAQQISAEIIFKDNFNTVSFLIGGSSTHFPGKTNTHVTLNLAADDSVIDMVLADDNAPPLVRKTFDASDAYDRNVYIEIVDNGNETGWAWIAVDDFKLDVLPSASKLKSSGVPYFIDSVLEPGESTVFQIVFTPDAENIFTGIVNIANSDPNKNPYTFAIKGEGVPEGGIVFWILVLIPPLFLSRLQREKGVRGI